MIFNYWTREFLDLKDGEEICTECSGYGMVMRAVLFENHKMCPKCWGHGKFDWIEKAVGKTVMAIGAIEL
jgi:DnaJ-class molecular chaperone